ncbi:hypothetical protein ES703_37178 [subsurface metagenome]
MAKVQAPLFGLGARNSIGQAVTYFPWKGLNVVRKYVIPANPNTTLQAAQRALMTAAVLAFHTALYTAGDMIAWNRLSGTLAKTMTGFNAMVRRHILEAIAGNTWELLTNVFSNGVLVDRFAVWCTKESGGNAPTVHYGTSKTFMPGTQIMADQFGNSWRGTPLGLSADTLYFFYIDVGTTGVDYARTGIYQQRTS